MKYPGSKKTLLLFIFAAFFCLNSSAQKKKDRFSFVFMTDLHLRQDSIASTAFSKVVRRVREINPDFVLVGGDQVFDVMRGNKAKGDSLFQYYVDQSKGFGKPVYNTVGNHELFGIYKESPEDSSHPDYKTGMYERYLGPTHYMFKHKGWYFFVLNVLDVENQSYIGNVDEQQMAWLKDELTRVPADAPITLMVHIPLVTAYGDIYPAAAQGVSQPLVRNRDDILEAFAKHRLKMVLQGHLHWFEDINVEGKTHFITGGAVAGRPSWKGERHGPRGFLKFDVNGDEATYKFIAYEQADKK